MGIVATVSIIVVVILWAKSSSQGSPSPPAVHIDPRALWEPPSGLAMFHAIPVRPLSINYSPVIAPSTAGSNPTPRNIYIDGGAKDATTMMFFEQAAHSPFKNTPWDVYSFEPCPIFFELDEYEADHLSHRNSAVRTPRYVSVPVSCGDEPEKFRVEGECKNALMQTIKFQQTVLSEYNAKPLDVAKVEQRLKRRPDSEQALPPGWFSFVPAAISSTDGVLQFSWSVDNVWNGGGTSVGIDTHDMAVQKFDVVAMDFAKWLPTVARPVDYVYVKLDIEGAEFAVLERLMETGAIHLIDELSIEFHERFDDSHTVETLIPGILYMLHSAGIAVHYHP
jgi:FkbM family methyltransferase